jgi:hypothetical protein
VHYCGVVIQTQVAMHSVQLQPHRHFEFSRSHRVVAVNGLHVGTLPIGRFLLTFRRVKMSVFLLQSSQTKEPTAGPRRRRQYDLSKHR